MIFSDKGTLGCIGLSCELHMIISLVHKSPGAIGAIEFIRIYRQNGKHTLLVCTCLGLLSADQMEESKTNVLLLKLQSYHSYQKGPLISTLFDEQRHYFAGENNYLKLHFGIV